VEASRVDTGALPTQREATGFEGRQHDAEVLELFLCQRRQRLLERHFVRVAKQQCDCGSRGFFFEVCVVDQEGREIRAGVLAPFARRFIEKLQHLASLEYADSCTLPWWNIGSSATAV
jgi:hypothetical protein